MKLKRLLTIMATLIPCVLQASAAIEQVHLKDGTTVSYQTLMEQYQLPGLSFAVVEDYQVVYQKNLGVKDLEKADKITAETAFSTASISKAIVGTLVVMLAEQGKLDLDTPVSQYLKRWSLPKSTFTQNTPITLRYLLTHTAGTTQGGFADFYPGDDKIPNLIDSLNGKLPRYDKPISIVHAPGSKWQYSGGGYVIVQVALEDTFGKPLAQLADEMLFTPLKMQHTTMYQHGEPGFLENVAKAHNKQTVLGIPICPQIAPSGMWSTPGDMAKLVIEMQKALAGDKTQVISTQVAKAVLEVQTLDTAEGWSLGWMRNEAWGNMDGFSHGGSNTGTGGHIWGSMADGKALLIFGNGANQSRIPVIDAVRDSIIQQLGWQKSVPVKGLNSESELVQKMTGRYLHPMGDVVELQQEQGKLKLLSRFFESELYYQGGGLFRIESSPNLARLKNNPLDKRDYLVYSRPGTDLQNYHMIKLRENEQLPYEVAFSGSLKDTVKAYKSWQSEYPDSHLNGAGAMNQAGYMALGQKHYKAAINLFGAYVQMFPKDANAQDSLAEAFMLKGDVKKATEHYQLALQMNPKNQNARDKLAQLQGQ